MEMITAAISLFFASLFAVKLSLIPDNAIGVSLGLVIWAAFFMLMFYLESRFIGGVFNAAFSAVKSGFELILGNSGVSKAENVIEDTVEKIREEAEDFISDSDLKGKFNEFFKKLEPGLFNMKNIKNELRGLINDISIDEKEEDGGKKLFLHVAGRNPKFSKTDVSLFGKIWDTVKSGLKAAGAAGLGASAISMIKSKVGDKKQAGEKNKEKRKIRKEEVEEYLKKTGEPLQADLLDAELQEIFNNPAHEIEFSENGKQLFDKNSVVILVSEKKGVDQSQARSVASRVEEAINSILHQAKILGMVKEKIAGIKDKMEDKKDEITENIESRIEDLLSKVERPELDFELLKKEFEFMMDNPKLVPEVLGRKLKQFDRNTFVSLLEATGKFSSKDAERIINKFEESREKVLMNIERAEAEIKLKAQQAKNFALEQAESTRKTAVAASWWLFGTLVISALAAVAGGMIAL